MEGVPRLYMIGLPPKQCSFDQKPDFVSAINYQIRKSYGRDPSLYCDDIDALVGIRQSAINAVMSPSLCTVDGCRALKRYYAHLVRLTEKFPKLLQQQGSSDQVKVKKVKDSAPPLIFTWKRIIGGKLNRPWQVKIDKKFAPPGFVGQKKKPLKHAKDVEVAMAAFDKGDIGFEMRCVLYNLGAAHLRLAAGQNRSPSLNSFNNSITEDEESPSNTALKIACTHLQCAAWAFEQLLGGGETNNKVAKWHHQDQPLVTNRIILEFAYNVSLAQAQECILEKSMMDGRKSIIIAKVSAMISDYFAVAVDAVNRIKLEKYCVNLNRLEKWQLYAEFKCRYYGAVTALFQGQHAQDQLQQMGTRVSYYQRAVNLLGRARDISELGANTESLIRKEEDSADEEYYYYLEIKHIRHSRGRSVISRELEMRRDTISFALDVAAAKWRAAKSENELIYHEHVETVVSDDDDIECLKVKSSSTTTTTSECSQLEWVKGASLVKPVGFNVDDPELLAVVVNTSESSCGTITTLFRDLVSTDTRHRADTYRSEKSIIEENLSSLCHSADDKLTEFVDTLQLECLEMFKDDSGEYSKDGNEKTDITELPQQLVNCCAAYQALLEQHRQGKLETSVIDKEDQLDFDMARLSSAVQAVDGMLDEMDRLLKTEELSDSEYRLAVGRPYDYSAGRMRELRREASRYREAHVGRARDSWVTLSQAVRDRRRRDLELLALPPNELAARLPPARPTQTSVSAEVAAAGALTSSTPYNTSSCSAKSPNQNDDSEKDGNGGHLRQLQRDSLDRLDRLNVVVKKLHEVRTQRRMLLSQLKDDMEQEEKDSTVAGQDDAAILGELRGSNIDIKSAIIKKLDHHYGKVVNLIEMNLSAQANVLEAVRTAYARASPERRVYANAIQRRRSLIMSLVDAYNHFATASKGTPLTTSSETSAASSTSGPLPDAILVERCNKGLDFYQRLQTNVSKLLQRVKGACQVQTEQRDQIMNQYQHWKKTEIPDAGLVAPIDGLENLLTNVSAVDNQDHHQKDLPDLAENFDINSLLNNLPEPPSDIEWDQQHHNHRRLSPLGSEQQQQKQKHRHSQMQPLPTSYNAAVSINKYDSCHDFVNNDFGVYENPAQSPQPVALQVMATNNARPSAYNPHLVGPTAVATRLINSNTTAISSPWSSSSAPSYNYYNYQLPSITSAAAAVNHTLTSPSYNDVFVHANDSSGIEASVSAMMNALRLGNNSGSQNTVSSYGQSGGNDGCNGGFPNGPAAIVSLHRTFPAQYNGGGGSSVETVGVDYGYEHPTTMLSSPLNPFYQPQQYEQQILSATTITSGSSGVGNSGIFVQQQQLQMHQQQQQFITQNGSISVSVQSPLVSTMTVNNGSTTAIAAHSSSITNVPGFSAATNFLHRPTMQQPQPPRFYQLPKEEQPELYHHHQQQQQQLELYQHQSQQYPQQPRPQYQQQASQIYQEHRMQQQQQQQMQQLLPSTDGMNGAGNFYYSSQQQHEQEHVTQTSQLYQFSQPQQQLHLQSAASLTSSSDGSCYYEQQLQQYHASRTMEAPAATAPYMTTTTSINSYFYQQPSAEMDAYDRAQMSQFYEQQPLVAPAINLLDDDLMLFGPPPIQPEKIVGNGGGTK